MADFSVFPGCLGSLALPVGRLCWGIGGNQPRHYYRSPCLLCREPNLVLQLTKRPYGRGKMAPWGTTSQTAGLTSLGRALSILDSRDTGSPRRVLPGRSTVRNREIGSTHPTLPDLAHQAGQGRLFWLWSLPCHLLCFLQVCQSHTLAERA